jgi:hypothetical protein
MDDRQRERIRGSLEKYFEKNSAPHFLLSLIVAFTGGVGFLVSWLLLHFQDVDMWIRYPVAVIAAYFVFLGLLRLWAEVERHRINPDTMERIATPELTDSRAYSGPSAAGNRSWFDVLDIIDFGEDEVAGCALIITGIVAAGSVIAVILSAPALIADVFLDAVLVTILYKHLKTAARQDWLGAAVRRTWVAVIVLLIALSAAGAVIQWHWPQAKSLGDIWHTPARNSR